MLHIVNKSPFERNSLESCLRLAKPGSAILLIEDATVAAVAGSTPASDIAARMGDFSFYVLGPDIDARGLGGKDLVDGIKVVDYGGFVDLTAEQDTCQSWL